MPAAVIAKLGLDARVTLLDAEVVGLDREGRVIELSDGSQLAYDVMLVACGMQEQTCNTFAETDLEVAGAIITSLELAADFSIGDATAMERIVVYGNTLEAYHALSVLEARGAAEKMQFIAPPSEESADPMVRVLRECAKMMKLLLPKPSLAVLKTLNSVPGDTRPVAVFEVSSCAAAATISQSCLPNMPLVHGNIPYRSHIVLNTCQIVEVSLGPNAHA